MLFTIAILPLGLIAVSLTQRVIMVAAESTQAALLGQTAVSASKQKAAFQQAIGAGEALGSTLEFTDTTHECSALLQHYIDSQDLMIFAAFVDMSGQMLCRTGDDVTRYTENPLFLRQLTSTSVSMVRLATGGEAQEALVLVSVPIFDEGVQTGFLNLSIPAAAVESKGGTETSRRPVDLITYNARGEILASDKGRSEASGQLPKNWETLSPILTGSETFKAESVDGLDRIYAVVPVIPGSAYAIGGWSPEQRLIWSQLSATTSLAFPILMWFVSLMVANLAIHRLVIRHIASLRARMIAFTSRPRRFLSPPREGAALEFVEIEQAFRTMTETIVREEADLEAALHEKDVLMKEVYHRVKNNLQLIASIMNMQIRKTRKPEVVRVVKSLRDRVMSLASIHRNLYQTEGLSSVRVDRMIDDIVNQMLKVGVAPGSNIRTNVALEPVVLYPDQAVPLSLLANEAMTNAIKYLGGKPPQLSVSLSMTEDKMVSFRVENSMGAVSPEPTDEIPSGLGSHLIQAFASQLEADWSAKEEGDRYIVSVKFQASDFDADDER